MARRQDLATVRHSGRPYRRTAVPRGGKAIFIFLKFIIFKTLLTFLKNNKLISVSIVTRSCHNQRVDANNLYKIMIKILLHLNMSVPIRPNNSSTSPGVVPGVRLGVRCPDHPRSELVGRWRRHGRRRQACSIQCPSAGRCRFARDVPPPTNDDPAPADVAPLAAGVAPPTGCVG
jgi:hypothetical protein